MHSDNDIAPVAYLRIHDADLIENEAYSPDFLATIPPLLDDLSEAVKRSAETASLGDCFSLLNVQSSHEPPLQFPTCAVTTTFSNGRKWISLSNVQINWESPLSVEEECVRCWDIVSSKNRDPRHRCHAIDRYVINFLPGFVTRHAPRALHEFIARISRQCLSQFHGTLPTY